MNSKNDPDSRLSIRIYSTCVQVSDGASERFTASDPDALRDAFAPTSTSLLDALPPDLTSLPDAFAPTSTSLRSRPGKDGSNDAF